MEKFHFVAIKIQFQLLMINIYLIYGASARISVSVQFCMQSSVLKRSNLADIYIHSLIYCCRRNVSMYDSVTGNRTVSKYSLTAYKLKSNNKHLNSILIFIFQVFNVRWQHIIQFYLHFASDLYSSEVKQLDNQKDLT